MLSSWQAPLSVAQIQIQTSARSHTLTHTHTHTHTHALAGGAADLVRAEHCLLRKNDASAALDEMMRELQSLHLVLK